MQIIEEIRSELRAVTDEKYCSFNKSLVPGDTAPMLGVRLPKLREIARKIAKENGVAYIEAIQDVEKCGQAYHEELLLHGMIIGYLKCGTKERKKLLDDFVPVIDSWAVCDSSCTTYKFMKKDTWEWYSYLMKYVQSRREYEIRFAVVCFLAHFITDEYIDRLLELYGQIDHEGYYVKMAVAWAVSVCYVKYPEKTWKILEGNTLDDITHKKSLQKIRESYRVSKEDKERLKSLARNTGV